MLTPGCFCTSLSMASMTHLRDGSLKQLADFATCSGHLIPWILGFGFFMSQLKLMAQLPNYVASYVCMLMTCWDAVTQRLRPTWMLKDNSRSLSTSALGKKMNPLSTAVPRWLVIQTAHGMWAMINIFEKFNQFPLSGAVNHTNPCPTRSRQCFVAYLEAFSRQRYKALHTSKLQPACCQVRWALDFLHPCLKPTSSLSSAKPTVMFTWSSTHLEISKTCVWAACLMQHLVYVTVAPPKLVALCCSLTRMPSAVWNVHTMLWSGRVFVYPEWPARALLQKFNRLPKQLTPQSLLCAFGIWFSIHMTPSRRPWVWRILRWLQFLSLMRRLFLIPSIEMPSTMERLTSAPTWNYVSSQNKSNALEKPWSGFHLNASSAMGWRRCLHVSFLQIDLGMAQSNTPGTPRTRLQRRRRHKKEQRAEISFRNNSTTPTHNTTQPQLMQWKLEQRIALLRRSLTSSTWLRISSPMSRPLRLNPPKLLWITSTHRMTQLLKRPLSKRISRLLLRPTPAMSAALCCCGMFCWWPRCRAQLHQSL